MENYDELNPSTPNLFEIDLTCSEEDDALSPPFVPCLLTQSSTDLENLEDNSLDCNSSSNSSASPAYPDRHFLGVEHSLPDSGDGLPGGFPMPDEAYCLIHKGKSYKSLLLELYQQQQDVCNSPIYKSSRTGLDHCPIWRASVEYCSKTYHGYPQATKVLAEANAAYFAWKDNHLWHKTFDFTGLGMVFLIDHENMPRIAEHMSKYVHGAPIKVFSRQNRLGKLVPADHPRLSVVIHQNDRPDASDHAITMVVGSLMFSQSFSHFVICTQDKFAYSLKEFVDTYTVGDYQPMCTILTHHRELGDIPVPDPCPAANLPNFAMNWGGPTSQSELSKHGVEANPGPSPFWVNRLNRAIKFALDVAFIVIVVINVYRALSPRDELVRENVEPHPGPICDICAGRHFPAKCPQRRDVRTNTSWIKDLTRECVEPNPGPRGVKGKKAQKPVTKVLHCFNCGSADHLIAKCPKPKDPKGKKGQNKPNNSRKPKGAGKPKQAMPSPQPRQPPPQSPRRWAPPPGNDPVPVCPIKFPPLSSYAGPGAHLIEESLGASYAKAVADEDVDDDRASELRLVIEHCDFTSSEFCLHMIENFSCPVCKLPNSPKSWCRLMAMFLINQNADIPLQRNFDEDNMANDWLQALFSYIRRDFGDRAQLLAANFPFPRLVAEVEYYLLTAPASLTRLGPKPCASDLLPNDGRGIAVNKMTPEEIAKTISDAYKLSGEHSSDPPDNVDSRRSRHELETTPSTTRTPLGIVTGQFEGESAIPNPHISILPTTEYHQVLSRRLLSSSLLPAVRARVAELHPPGFWSRHISLPSFNLKQMLADYLLRDATVIVPVASYQVLDVTNDLPVDLANSTLPIYSRFTRQYGWDCLFDTRLWLAGLYSYAATKIGVSYFNASADIPFRLPIQLPNIAALVGLLGMVSTGAVLWRSHVNYLEPTPDLQPPTIPNADLPGPLKRLWQQPVPSRLLQHPVNYTSSSVFAVLTTRPNGTLEQVIPFSPNTIYSYLEPSHLLNDKSMDATVFSNYVRRDSTNVIPHEWRLSIMMKGYHIIDFIRKMEGVVSKRNFRPRPCPGSFYADIAVILLALGLSLTACSCVRAAGAAVTRSDVPLIQSSLVFLVASTLTALFHQSQIYRLLFPGLLGPLVVLLQWFRLPTSSQ